MAESDRPELSNAASPELLAEVARRRISKIEGDGDPLAARDILRTAVSALRGILAGGHLDAEHRECLEWLARALGRLNLDHDFGFVGPKPADQQKQIDANKALGLTVAHAPQLPEERGMLLCLWTHEELGKPRYRALPNPHARSRAFAEVAKRATKRLRRRVTVRQVADAWKVYAASKRPMRSKGKDKLDK